MEELSIKRYQQGCLIIRNWREWLSRHNYKRHDAIEEANKRQVQKDGRNPAFEISEGSENIKVSHRARPQPTDKPSPKHCDFLTIESALKSVDGKDRQRVRYFMLQKNLFNPNLDGHNYADYSQYKRVLEIIEGVTKPI